MRYGVFAFLSLFFLPFVGRTQSSKNQSILHHEDSRFQAMMRRDTAALSSWLSDNLLYRHSNGLLEDKQRHLQAIATETLVYERIERDSVHVERWGRMAIVNGVVRVAGRLEQAPFEVRLSYLAVYRKKGGRWQLIRWQSTRLP